jgi:N-acetylmuramoyl-L-alanine amidase
MKVCVDPGHGGYDPGAVGNGLQEKDITLAIALQLRPMLVFNGIDVTLTRDGDYAPGHLEHDLNGELNKRVSISDNSGAGLFVSIHINSGGGTGEEVLVAGLGGQAVIAANKLLYYLLQATGWANRGTKVQNVLVLKETHAPAALTENGFIDSIADSTKLKDPAFIHELARAHAKGICDYFGIVYKDPTQIAVVAPPATDKVTQAINLLNQAISILKG